MNINNINGLNGVSGINQASAINRANNTQAQNAAKNVQADQVSINATNAADVSNKMEPNGIRVELVNRIREQIANGTYDIEGKFAIAMEKMFADGII